jgi:hypothetical protein
VPTEVLPGVVITLAKLESVDGTANGPGEVAGPAVRVTVQISNTGVDPISLSGAIANMTYGTDSTPASPLSGPGVVSFPATLAPKGVANGVFVFAVPRAAQKAVTLTVSYSAAASPAVFHGSVPE